MNTPSAVAIYARISSDLEGLGAGVARQVKDCRGLADSLGWGVAGEYVDNDLSAYSGKRRPEYQRMLADLSEGALDSVLVWHIDRLTRRPIELEQFMQVVDAAGVRHVKFVTGDTDLTSGDGMLMARVMGAVAANESASKSRRLRRKLEEIAALGEPNGGQRPFGYADDRVTIVPEEAAIVRTLVARCLAGESTRSLCTWLVQQGVASATGKPWRTTTVRGILTSPRHAGLRQHQGVVVGPAVWKAIISEEDHRRVLAQFAQRKTSGRRVPRRYLLSGMVKCGKCGNRLFSSVRVDSRRYVCLAGPDHGGCGKLTIVADPLERLVAEAVLFRLDTAELADALAGRNSADARTQELTAALDEATEHLEDLAKANGARAITMREWMIAKKPVEQRREAIQRQLATTTQTHSLRGLVGNGEELRASWESLNLSRQHAIVAALVDHVDIGPGTAGAQRLDRGRVSIVWRV